jgi:chromate reductase, NAD(P)H dehydrogenase (quinone)
MTKILIVPGSLRKASWNLALANAAAQCTPDGCATEVATIHGIPLYDGDLEDREGIPEAVLLLKEKIVAADGLLLVTPEYNHSIPGVFKNAIDWLSRPPKDSPRVFRGRPVALMGASTGMVGTRLAQNAWLPVFRTLGLQFWSGGALFVGPAQKLFSGQGELTDADLRERLEKFMRGFAGFVAAPGRR